MKMKMSINNDQKIAKKTLDSKGKATFIKIQDVYPASCELMCSNLWNQQQIDNLAPLDQAMNKFRNSHFNQ